MTSSSFKAARGRDCSCRGYWEHDARARWPPGTRDCPVTEQDRGSLCVNRDPVGEETDAVSLVHRDTDRSPPPVSPLPLQLESLTRVHS